MAKRTRKSDELVAVETEHGFVFGDADGESAGAPATLSVVCSNMTCPRRGQHVQLHEDTAGVISCGGCGTVLHCDHPDTTLTTHHEGTLQAPRQVARTVCTTCNTELTRTETNLPPISIDQVPLHLLGGLTVDAIVAAQ